MGGQACILYGAAEFSRDVDFAVAADDKNLSQLRQSHPDEQHLLPLSKLTKVSDNSSGPDIPRGEQEVLKEEIDVPHSFSFLSRSRIVVRLLGPCVPGHRRQSERWLSRPLQRQGLHWLEDVL